MRAPRVLLTLILIFLWVPGVFQPVMALDAASWSEDIDVLIAAVMTNHPDPWEAVSRDEWLAGIEAIRRQAGHQPAAATAVALMQQVARMGDTHTNALPSAAVGFDRWFPYRIYQFSDGYFLTAIDRSESEWAGAQVLAMDGTDIVDAARLAGSLRSAENAWGQREATHYLSSPVALHALGIIPSPDRVSLEVINPRGQRQELVVEGRPGSASMAWAQWGEMFGPIFEDDRTLVTAFDDLSPMDYRQIDTERPLHLRHRGRYAFWPLPGHDAIYAQINFLVDDGDTAFEEGFMRSLFDAVDKTGVGRLILDLRYNGGGDGSMAIPFVHELIKRDQGIGRPGHLYVLVGRKTFSAAVGLLDQITDHTAALLVGEPPRSPFNHYGDPTRTLLPHSGMAVDVSNRYWQFALSDDNRTYIPLHFPALFSSEAYFSGRDPAVEAILSGQVVDLPGLIRAKGAAAAEAIIGQAIAQNGQPDWWVPFDRRAMRHTGRDLIKAGRLADGVAAYRLNARFHGQSWRVWDSLGDGLNAMQDWPGALAAYRKALELKPDNWNAGHQNKMIETLQAEAQGSMR